MYKLVRMMVLMVLCNVCACSVETNYSYDYLMTHPKALASALDRCHDTNTSPSCANALNAAKTFSALVAAQQMQPEAFGEKIMKQEFDLTLTKQALQQAQEAYHALQTKPGSDAELQAANEKVIKLKQTFRDQQQHLQEDLAVMTLGSPE